jgi:K+ transporter
MAYRRKAMRSASPTTQAAGRAALMVGALGVVFGDIGTSPLYAMQAALAGEDGPLTREEVYGPVSLVFWTVTLVVSVKYVTFIMRADNDGEGGVMALIALVQRTGARGWRASARSSSIRASWRRCRRRTESASSPSTGAARSWCSDPSCSP